MNKSASYMGIIPIFSSAVQAIELPLTSPDEYLRQIGPPKIEHHSA